MELLSSINNSGIGAQYAVSAAKDVNGNEITSTYLTAVPEGYATESFVTSQGYITGSYLTADALDNVSGTWNTVTNKLDSTAFSTVSGNFLTAHQSLPNSANWNSTYNTVIGNSAKWNDTYDTVHDNSASWTGGGASVTSPRGTININGDEIEGTNSAALFTITGGFVTGVITTANNMSFTDMWMRLSNDSLGSNSGGTMVMPFQNPVWNIDGIMISGRTETYNTASASAATPNGAMSVSIPLGEITREMYVRTMGGWVNLSGNYVTVSAEPKKTVTGVGELAWNSALDSIRYTSATWNNTTDTVYSNSASWGAGSTYTGDAQGALDEVYTNSGNWNTVTDKLDSTAFSTVSGDFLTAHQSLSNSANWDSTYTTVNTNSASWSTVTDKLDSTAFSTVSGNFLTAHQALPNSGNWDETYTTVSTNSADWNSAAAMNELPVSAGQGMDIQNVDGTIVFSCTGGSVPEGVLVESGLEYNAVNEISGYSGSAFAQPSISAAEWNSNYETVNTNSGAWGGAALPISAGPGVKVELTDGKLLFSTDETVLYSGSSANPTLSESIDNFEHIKVTYTYWPGNYATKVIYGWSDKPTVTDGWFNAAGNTCAVFITRLTANDAHTVIGSDASKYWNPPTGTSLSDALSNFNILEVIGVNRTAGGN